MLSHFVGDIHQPLHVSFAVDFGGNDFTVTYLGTSTNLHSVWDTSMINTWLNGKIWQDKAIEIVNELKTNPYLLADYQNVTDVQKWANESYFHTRYSCYNIEPGTASTLRNYDDDTQPMAVIANANEPVESLSASQLIEQPQHEPSHCCREIPQSNQVSLATTCQATLDTIYYERNIPIIEQRLAMAGARLAYLLNSIYDPNSDAFPSENLDLKWRMKMNIAKLLATKKRN